MTRRLPALLLLTLALLSAGCDSGGEDADPTVTGNYSDVITLSNGATASFEMTLQERDGDVSGDGTISGPGGSAALSVNGTHNHPDVSLTFSSSGFRDFNLTGDVSENGDRISGELTGSELSGVTVSMTRD